MIPKSEPNFQVLQQSLHNFSITQLHHQSSQQQQQQQSVIQPQQQMLSTSQSHNVQLLQQPITNTATTTIVPNRQLTKQNNIQQLNQQQNCSSTANTNTSSSGPTTSVSSSNNFSIADQTTTGNNIISIASNQQKLNDKIIQKMVAEIPNTILNKYRQRLIVDEQPKSPSETPPTLASGNLLASPTNSSKNAANSKDTIGKMLARITSVHNFSFFFSIETDHNIEDISRIFCEVIRSELNANPPSEFILHQKPCNSTMQQQFSLQQQDKQCPGNYNKKMRSRWDPTNRQIIYQVLSSIKRKITYICLPSKTHSPNRWKNVACIPRWRNHWKISMPMTLDRMGHVIKFATMNGRMTLMSLTCFTVCPSGL